jgi:hypothetical protein
MVNRTSFGRVMAEDNGLCNQCGERATGGPQPIEVWSDTGTTNFCSMECESTWRGTPMEKGFLDNLLESLEAGNRGV